MKLYFDIDTQIDFMFPAGALYVPGAEKLLPLIATLNRAAVAGGGKVISTMCAHTEGRLPLGRSLDADVNNIADD